MPANIALDSLYPAAGVNAQQADWINLAAPWVGQGVVRGISNEFAVSQRGAGANMSVDVAAGRCVVQGIQGNSGGVKNLTVTTADATNPRKDRVVFRLDTSTTPPTYDVRVVTGVAAPVPTPPALTRAGSVYEVSLAQIAVAAGATSIVTANVTDERSWATQGAVQTPSVASATTPALTVGASPVDSVNLVIPVTGAVTITTLPVAPAGSRIALVFASAGCQVTNGSNLKLTRNFISGQANAVLLLHSDGTNWIEDSRAGEQLPLNQVIAGPASVGAGLETVRALVRADLPTLTQTARSVGSATSPTTTSTTFVDLDGDGNSARLLASLTMLGGALLFDAAVSLSCSASANLAIKAQLSLDNGATWADITGGGIMDTSVPGAGVNTLCTVTGSVSGIAAGTAIAVKIQWKTTAGTATANGTSRYLRAVELGK
jgi:hypothetical protein